MATLIAEYKVRDFDAFMAVFHEFQATRAELGATGHRLLRSVDDATVVNAIIEFPSPAAARRFADDPRRAEALERAGVLERCDEVFEEVEARTY
jgi:uncharacterized protein (DUF1330 family)